MLTVVLLFVALTGEVTCFFSRSYSFKNKPFVWADAQAYCREKAIDLATITKKTNFSYCELNPCWIGLRKNPTETAFTQWSDGSEVNYVNWEFGEPSNMDTSDCVSTMQYTWTNYACTIPMPFVCYRWVPQIILVQKVMNWEDALKYCRTTYTDLISLSTAQDLGAVNMMSMPSNTPSVWTGLRFLNGRWFNTNKQPVQNMTSMASCPRSPYRCGALKAGSNVLENRNCNEEMYFLCYQT